MNKYIFNRNGVKSTDYIIFQSDFYVYIVEYPESSKVTAYGSPRDYITKFPRTEINDWIKNGWYEVSK